MNNTIGIIGNDFILSTSLVEKIILKTKADTDQEHIKMNIVINNKLEKLSEKELKKIIINLEKSEIKYLVLIISNQNIFNFIKNNTTIEIINTYNDNINQLVEKVITLSGKELKK